MHWRGPIGETHEQSVESAEIAFDKPESWKGWRGTRSGTVYEQEARLGQRWVGMCDGCAEVGQEPYPELRGGGRDEKMKGAWSLGDLWLQPLLKSVYIGE